LRCGNEMMEKVLGAPGTHVSEVPEVTVSIGVASCPEHASAAEELVKAADEAMYSAKRSRKGKVVVSAAVPAPALVPVETAV